MCGGRRGRWLLAWVIWATLASACGSSGPDPALTVTDFASAPCTSAADADACFAFGAEVVGTQAGEGTCEIVALDADGSELFVARTFGPLGLEPGRTYEWFVALPAAEDEAFDTWAAECAPARG